MRKLFAVVVLAALAVAGCGGSSKSSGTPGSGGSGGDGSGGGGNSEFSKILAKTAKAKYKVTYRSDNDTPFTIAQDPPRFSYNTGDSATYVTADGSAVSCSGTGADASCTALPGSGDSIKQGLGSAFGAIGALFLSEAGKNLPGLANIKTTKKTIAGRNASCATLDGSLLGALSAAIKGSYSVCVDDETGVMLETTSDDGKGQTTTIRATDFGDPTDADLTPPATPNTIPSVPAT